jgi:hypothetical protein
MDAFHIRSRKYSIGATYFVCLELDFFGVDILFLLRLLLGRGPNANVVSFMAKIPRKSIKST